MKWLIIVVLTALLLIAAGIVLTSDEDRSPLSDNAEAVQLYREGTRDMHAFRLRAAVDKLDRALALDPELAEAAISRAIALKLLGRQADYMLGVVHADSLVQDLKKESRRMIAQLRLSSEHPSRYFVMRDSLLAELQRRQPENLYVLEAAANQAAMTGTPEEQETAWLKLLEVDPNYGAAYNRLGYMEVLRGNYERAIEYMQKYAFLAPDEANPHDSLGEVYHVIGEYEKAEKEFRLSVTMQPDFYHSLINLGKVYLARGQLDMGFDILNKVRQEVAGSEFEKRIDRRIIHTYMLHDLDAASEQEIVSYINKYPDDFTTPAYRALRLVDRGRPDTAEAVGDSMMSELQKRFGGKGGAVGDAMLELGSKTYTAFVADRIATPERRVELWRRVVELQDEVDYHDPDQLHQWHERFRLAQALFDAGRPAEALDELDRILMVNPRLLQPLRLAVECDLALQRPEAAEQSLQRLQWALAKADDDLPIVARAAELTDRVRELVASS